jgi:hypothetical protein
LVEKNPRIANIWKWLISSAPEAIRALPVHEPGELIPPEVVGPARDWIGFWNSISMVAPNMRMSPSAGKIYSVGSRRVSLRSSFWSADIRDRSADAAQKIKHWLVYEGSYDDIPDVEATWFVDPPYKGLNLYRQGDIDYDALALWCLQRRGQVIVCENEGADWLPFSPFRDSHAAPRKGGGRRSKEAICTWSSSDLAR